MALLSAALEAGGAEAQSIPDPPRPTVPLESLIRDLDDDGIPDRVGDTVAVRGVAGAETGELSLERLEVPVDDGTAGIVLNAAGFDRPIRRGDTVVAYGVIGVYQGREQLNTLSYEVVGHGPPPEPIVVPGSPAGMKWLEGRVVRVAGDVLSVGANRGGQFLSVMSADGEAGPFLVFVRATARHAGMLAPFGPKDHVEVTGVLTQYDASPPYRSGYQVMPRDGADVRSPFFSHRLLDRLWIGALVVGGLLLVWVTALRRQVAVQTDAVRRTEGERHRLEMLLQERRRLEVLGDLAGGIAHEFNNLLVGVMANAGLLRESELLSEGGRESLGGIETAARKAAALTRQMLSFAGRSHLEMADVSVDRLVQEELPRLHATVARGFEIDAEVHGASLARADEDQLRDILHALVTNAAEASGGRPGRATIRTGDVTLTGDGPTDLAGGAALGEGRWVTLSVHDDGPGIAPELAARVFDPYFSTKFHRQGLGLPAALGVVRSLGGGMAFRSAEGGGTEVTVYLPVADNRERAP